MKNIDNNSLIVKKNSLFNKVLNFIENIFFINKKEKINNYSFMDKNNADFDDKIKIDSQKLKLLKIKNNLKKEGVNEKKLIDLTKNLTEDEIIKLKQLYKEENEELKNKLNVYKSKILIYKN